MGWIQRWTRRSVLGLGALALAVSVLLAAGWEDETCGTTETWNGQSCTLEWCVNTGLAYYICGDGLATRKDCPLGDCVERVD